MTLPNKSLFFLRNSWYNDSGDGMGKYSLVVVNKNEKSRHIINVYDLEKKEYKQNVHIKDIDAFTSKFSGGFDFIKYLNEKGIINFSDASVFIISKYQGKEFYYKTIFNSDKINDIARTVRAGYLDATNEGYSDAIEYFYNHVKEKKFEESIENAVTIPSTLKIAMLQYIEILNNADNEKGSLEDLQEKNRLRWKINEELKRYKTFRGFYIFVEQYKKYGFVKKPVLKYNDEMDEHNHELQKKETVNLKTTMQEPLKNDDDDFKSKVISNVDDYNREYDEFLSEEEYRDAYGADKEEEYVLTKGAKHDKHTK